MALNDLDKRVRYFPGQYLLEEDFEHEQNYHRDRLQRINRQLHVSGITDGLKVIPGDSLTVNITKGDAIDDQGQQIVLLSQTSFKIEDGTSGTHVLYILYPDPEKQKLDDFQQAGDNNTGRRLHEQPIFSLVPQGETTPKGAIALAKLTIQNNNIVTPIDETVRQYSGLRLPSGDAVNTPTLRSSGNSNPSLVMLQGSLRVTGDTTVDGGLTITSTTRLSGKLTVNNQVELKGAVGKIGLVVDGEGRVGIGTSSPQASLSIETPESYGGDTIKFEAQAEPTIYNLSLNTEVTDSNVRWVFNQVNNNRYFKSVLSFDRGNVGIGIANPQARLDVRSSSIGSGTLTTVGTTVTGASTEFLNQLKVGHMITATYSANGKSYTETRRVTTITDKFSLTVDSPFTSNIITGTNFTFQSPLLAVQNGKVGIGTITPDEVLDVNGTIKSSSGGFKFPDNTLQTTAVKVIYGEWYWSIDQQGTLAQSAWTRDDRDVSPTYWAYDRNFSFPTGFFSQQPKVLITLGGFTNKIVDRGDYSDIGVLVMSNVSTIGFVARVKTPTYPKAVSLNGSWLALGS